MYSFNDNCNLVGGVPATVQELIAAAITARTYSAVPATDATRKADEISRWRATNCARLIIRPIDGDILMVDAYKSVINGVVTQSGWAAGDFTTGEPVAVTQNKTLQSPGLGNTIGLGDKVLFAAVNTIINIEAEII